MESLYEKSLTLLFSNFETMVNRNILECELVKIAHSLVLIYASVLLFLHCVLSLWYLLVMGFHFTLCHTFIWREDTRNAVYLQHSCRTGSHMGVTCIEHPFLQACKKYLVWLFIHLCDFFLLLSHLSFIKELSARGWCVPVASKPRSRTFLAFSAVLPPKVGSHLTWA